MKKNLFLVLFLICNFQQAISQNTRLLPTKSLSFNIGRGKLGTGDIQGLMLGVEYERYFQKRLSWSTELGMTIHDGSDLFLVTEANGNIEDLSYRYTTAGVQLAGKIGYNFLKTEKLDFGIRVGGIFRYQSSSLADDITIYIHH